jgi:hypothetical protein
MKGGITMKLNKFKTPEKGIAIVFALGIVALLLVIALGFVTTAIITKKTEENLSSLTIARMTAESGLQRVMVGMKANSSESDIDYWNIVSHEPDADSDPVYYEDLPTLMANVEDGAEREVFDWNTYYPSGSYDPADSDHITWQYLPSGHDISTPIVARFAYIVVDSLDLPAAYYIFGKKLDPSASIDSGLNAYNHSIDAISENYPVSEATSVDSGGNTVIGRPGRDVSELFLATIPAPFIGQTDTAEKLSVTNADPTGLLPYNTRWFDLNELCDSFSTTGTPIVGGTKNSFKDVFTFVDIGIVEAFAYTDTYDIRTYDGLFHRFNLTRAGWGSLNIEDIADTVNYLIPYDPDDLGDPEKCIPWLANWKFEGGFGSSVDSYNNCRNQIIANLIDYNDSNDIPTTDYPGTDPPTYVGLEKCPYINELKLEVEAEVEESGGGELFVNNHLYIKGSSNSFSGGHVNGDIKFWNNKFYNSTNGQTINYVGNLINQGNNNPNFLTLEVGSTQTQQAKPTEPAAPITPPDLNVATPQAIPSLINISLPAYKALAQNAGTYYTTSVTLTESGTGIKVKKQGPDPVIPNNSIIYVKGNNKNITIGQNNFDRQVTLISEGGKVNIKKVNTDLTPATNASSLQVYAKKNITANKSGCSLGGNVWSNDSTVTISGAGCNISGYIHAKGKVTISGNNCTVGAIESKDSQLVVSSSGNTINGTVKCKDDIKIQGNGSNTIEGSIEGEDLFLIDYDSANNLIKGSINCKNKITIDGKNNTIKGSAVSTNSYVGLTGWTARGGNAIEGSVRCKGNFTMDSPNNTIKGSVETEGNFLSTCVGNKVEGSVQGDGTFFIDYDASNNTIKGSVNCIGNIVIEGKKNIIEGSLQSSNSYVKISGWSSKGENTIGSIKSGSYTTIESPNNIIEGTIWSNNKITISDYDNNRIGATRSALETKFQGTGHTISDIAWSNTSINIPGTSTFSINTLCATTTMSISGTTINNCSLLWSGGNMLINNACTITGGSISCGGNLTVQGNSNNISGSSSQAIYTANVLLKDIDLELVNMYNTVNTCNADVTVEGTYNWILDGTDSEVNFSTTHTFSNLAVPGEAYTDTSYSGAGLEINPSPATRTGSAGLSTSIEDFMFSDLHVKLKNGSSFYDFAYLDSTVTGNTITADGTKASYFYDYQVADPRQNLLTTNWLKQNGTSSSIGTIGTVNSNWNPVGDGVDSDLELDTEPWGISTAYIRSAAMKSPWELGFIHRGKAWQTINLKKYNSTEGVSGGGNTYSAGDANILDQIKMTSDTATYGKINVNSDVDIALRVLVQKINIGSDVSSLGGPGALSGTEIDATNAQTLAAAFKNNSGDGVDSSKHFYSRGQILRETNGMPELYNNTLGLSQITDATQEELVGKFINLATALKQLPDQFCVIVVAQILKDNGIKDSESTVDVNGVSCKAGRYDVGGDEILGTQYILATVRRDPATDKFYIIEFEYID